jgi:hypothetical protein
MKSTITISELSDPEQAASHSFINRSYFDYKAELTSQIKLNLLFSEKIYMPLGFIIDNPALWDFFNDEAFLEMLIPSNRTNKNSLMSIGVSYPKNNSDAYSFKEAFNFWRVGANRDRELRPSSLRVSGVSSSMNNEQFNLWNNRNRDLNIELSDYASALGLNELLSVSDKIERVFHNSRKAFNPLNRHEILIDKILNCQSLDQYISNNPRMIKSWGKLQNHININGLKSISRSDIGNALGETVWQEVAPIINSWRSEGYIENVQSEHIPISMTSNLMKVKLQDEIVTEINDCQKKMKFKDPNWQLAIERLDFKDIISIRKDPDFIRIISKISLFKYSESEPKESLAAHDEFIKKEWAPCLLDIITSIKPNAIGLGVKSLKRDGMCETASNTLKGTSLATSLAALNHSTGYLLIPSLPFLSVSSEVGVGVAISLLAISRFQNYIRPTNHTKRTLIGQLQRKA